MIDKNKYDILVKKGTEAENIFINHMNNNGYRFLAGDVNRETINIDYIEECFPCRFIPHTMFRGAKLMFNGISSNVEFIMPDVLMIYSKNGKRSWFDVKSRTLKTLNESKYKLVHYYGVQYYTGVDSFISLVIWEGDGYNIYTDSIERYVCRKDLEKLEKGFSFKGEVIEFKLSNFIKQNRHTIK